MSVKRELTVLRCFKFYALSDTSRHMRSYETDGREYFFVSRQTMETFISKKKLIEFGEYKGCLYGTSKDSIKRALKTGKTCVLKVQPEVSVLATYLGKKVSI